jgi:hypothetical protein
MQVLKLILQKLQEPCADGIYHLSYGMVELPHGKMKSREGNVVDADDMVAEMTQIAQKNTEELGKVEGFTQEELLNLYNTLGLGALKFYLLRVDPKKKMIFNPEESIDFHGFTGPFIQYTHARISSILRKANEIELKNSFDNKNIGIWEADDGQGTRERIFREDITYDELKKSLEYYFNEMDSQKAAEMAKKYPKEIVGFKLAHFNGRTWVPTDRLMEAGKSANLPVIVDFGGASPFLPLDSLFNVKFRPGDIYTHAFGGNGSTSPNGRESIVDVTTNKVKPFVIKAQNRGVIFDVGFGGSSFLFNQGTPAIKSGFYPNSISTDLHTGSMNNAMKSMPNIMSLFMAMGMDLQSVIKASTWNPAQHIRRPELGHLTVGAEADVAIFTLREGNFGFYARDGKIAGKNRLETEMTIRGGSIVYNLNAIAEPNILPSVPRTRPARPASN